MNHPKLKYPRLCRILTYIVVIGTGLLPTIVFFNLPVPDGLKVIVLLGSLIGLLIYLIRNFLVLMMMDMVLAMESCYRTARSKYHLPQHRSADAIRSSILRYGVSCDPSPIKPTPSALRYKLSNPMTVYSRGIEKVVVAYEIDLLTRDLYRDIFSSAKTNSRFLTGRKKARFLDKEQKKQPLHRVTVIVILAHKIDAPLVPELYDLVCKQCGNEDEDCLVPCVIDLENHTCVFNCLRVPYVGFNYAVKNRGIRIIKNRVFGGSLPLTDEYRLSSMNDADPEMSLWDFWRELHHQVVGAERKTKKQFEAMSEREIRMVGDVLYLKWDQRGICQTVEFDTESKTAKVESVTNWAYPKSQPIGKKTIRKIEDYIFSYFQKQEYTVTFFTFE